jgi:hypothetical protein
VVTADELPAGMPERMKQMLIKADKNGDKQLTKEELKEAIKQRQAEAKPEKRPEGRPDVKHFAGRPPMPPRDMYRPGKGSWEQPRYRYHASLPKTHRLRMIFNRWDRNHDGVLSYKEFKAGSLKMQKALAKHHGRTKYRSSYTYYSRGAGWNGHHPRYSAQFQFHGPRPEFRTPGPQRHRPEFCGRGEGWQQGHGQKSREFAMNHDSQRQRNHDGERPQDHRHRHDGPREEGPREHGPHDGGPHEGHGMGHGPHPQNSPDK